MDIEFEKYEKPSTEIVKGLEGKSDNAFDAVMTLLFAYVGLCKALNLEKYKCISLIARVWDKLQTKADKK